MSDTTILTPPPGNLNSQTSQGLLAPGTPSGEVTAGATLITIGGVQKTLAAWLGGTPRNQGRMQLEWVSGATVANDTVYFAYDAPYAGTLNYLQYFAGTGSFTLSVQINGVSVTGLTALSVASATPAQANATGANTFAAGAHITGVITAASGSPADVLLSLAATWS
jgi:hypothetical protein